MVQSIENDIRTHLNNYRHYKKIPGLAAGMVSSGEKVLARGFGTRKIDDLYSRVSSDTTFSIQSLTQSFTAQALMHLDSYTDFNLDLPVIHYLPYFRTKTGPYYQITTRQILSHTAGFPDDVWITTLLDERLVSFVNDMPEYRFLREHFPDMKQWSAQFQSREAVTRYFGEVKLIADPGEILRYCSDAYVIAADVLEKVSGLSWERYVATHILQPLGMTRTFINPVSPLEETNTASYYLKTIDTPIETPRPHNEVAAPIGFMYSTVTDLLSYLQAQLEADERIMPKSAYEQMQAPHSKHGGELSFGLGWQVKWKDGVKNVTHAGNYPGVSSFAAMVPEHQLGIVLLANTDSLLLEKLADKVMGIWLRKSKSR